MSIDSYHEEITASFAEILETMLSKKFTCDHVLRKDDGVYVSYTNTVETDEDIVAFKKISDAGQKLGLKFLIGVMGVENPDSCKYVFGAPNNMDTLLGLQHLRDALYPPHKDESEKPKARIR